MARLSRDEWLEGAFRVLAERGPDAMGISALSEALGVTKGSFYWHFESRQALLDAMFEVWEAEGTARIIDGVDARSEDPGVRLHHLASVVFGDAKRYDAIEANLRFLARGNAAALAAVERVDARRLTYVRDLLRAAGVPRVAATRRAEAFYRALIGEFTWREAGGAPLSEEARTELVDLLLSS